MKQRATIIITLASLFIITSGIVLHAHAALTFSSTTITGDQGVTINGSTTISGNATTTGNLTILGSLRDASGNAYVTSTSGSVGSNITANTLSATTSDGSATISGFSVNNIVSLNAFGCKGDGVTDDAPCIRAAYAYLVAHYPNGGTIQGDPTAKYLVDSYAPAHAGCPTYAYFCFPASNITYKDMYIIGGGLSGGAFQVFTFITRLEYGTLNNPVTFYPMNNVNRGDDTITLTSAGNASNFAVGDLAFLQGETSDVNDQVQNKITAISGGVLTFQYPFAKPFNTGSPQIADVQSATTFNQTFDNVTIMLGAGDVSPDIEAAANITFDHIDFEQAVASADSVMGGNEVYGFHITNSKFVTAGCNGGGQPAGGAGSSHAFIENNDFINYGCATSSGAGVEGGEGTEDLHFIGNTISNTDTGSGPEGLDLSATWDATVADNTIYVASSSTDPVVTDNGASANYVQCVDCTVTGNVMVGGNVNYSLGSNDLWTGNTFYGNKLALFGKAVVSGNYFYATSAPSTGAIIVENNSSSLSSDITGNTIVNTGAVTGNGIYISDPGSVSTDTLTISGNVITGFTNPIFYNASASIDLPNRVVQGNSGATDYRGDSISFGIPSATSTYPLSVSGTIALFGVGNGIRFPDGTVQTTIAVNSSSSPSSSPWTTIATTSIYYNLGDVGIGTTTPAAELSLGTGQIEVPNGSAAAPSYSFSNATNNGFYSTTTATLDITIAGSNAVEMQPGVFQFEGRSVFIDNAAEGFEIGSGNIPQEGFFSPGVGKIEIASGSTANANGTLLANTIGIGIGTAAPSTTLQVAGATSTIRIGISGSPGCLEMYDAVNSTTLNYIYPSSGALLVTSTKPSNCQ